MLLKCCTQYVSKFGKHSSGPRTGKGQFSFPSQRRAVPKNFQIIAQLQSFHVLAKLCSKSLKLGFSGIWTENFQMYKLGLEKAEEPEIQLPTLAGSQTKQRNSRKNIYFCFIDYAKAFECVNHNKLWKILKKTGIPDHLTCLLRTCMQVRKQQLELDMEQQTGSK